MTSDDAAGGSGSAGDDAGMRRRRAVVAGHGGDRDGAAALTGDRDPTVRAAALGALARLGALDDDGLVRRTR